MRLKIVFLLSAWAALSFGLPSLLFPELMSGMYGITRMSANEVLMTRMGGALWMAIGLISWFMRSAKPSTERDGIVLALIFTYASSFGLTLLGIVTQVHNGMGSATVVVDLLLTLGFAYFRFIKRES